MKFWWNCDAIVIFCSVLAKITRYHPDSLFFGARFRRAFFRAILGLRTGPFPHDPNGSQWIAQVEMDLTLSDTAAASLTARPGWNSWVGIGPW